MRLPMLKEERDRLRESLRDLEAELRRAEAGLKTLRQKEIQTKREIDAYNTLIDINEAREAKVTDVAAVSNPA